MSRALLFVVLVSGDNISINVTQGGTYTFEPGRALYSFIVSAGSHSTIFINKIEYDESPPNTAVYKFLEMGQVNAVSDLNMTFVFPKNWLESVGGHKDNLVIMELRDTTWSEINSRYFGADDAKHFVKIRVETLPDLVALGVEVWTGTEETEEPEEDEAPTENGKTEGVTCAEPGDWSECSNGRKTRTAEILVNGVCVEQAESGICFTDLDEELWIPRLVVLFVLVTVACVSYFVFKLKGL